MTGPTTIVNSLRTSALVGSPNEVSVRVDGVNANALLDTGATVSTVSDKFRQDYLSHVPVKQLDTLLKVECADGEQLPYSGYIEASVIFEGLGDTREITCLLLVVPSSNYNAVVPLLIGTNILSVLMDDCSRDYGARYAQHGKLATPWFLAFRCLSLRNRDLARNKNVIALVKNAASVNYILKPNTTVTMKGFVDQKVPYPITCAVIQPSARSTLSGDIDVTPAVISCDASCRDTVDVHLSNITTHTFVIPPGAILCEIQPATVQEMPATKQDVLPKFMEKIDFSESAVDGEDLQTGIDLIKEYEDIFSHGDDDLGLTHLVEHHIELSDSRPFKQRHRKIPPSMYEEVRSHLQQLLSAGVIRPSHSPFASNIVLVRKKDGSLRMCVDFRQLNKWTIRDSYALPRIDEILESLSGSKYFTKLDLKSGYHQISITEQHKERTAFTVGPLGFFEFNRMPFGLTNAPATFQRLMEQCMGDLNLTICLVYIDDLIVFADNYEEHLDRLQRVFRRLRESNLKLSPKKCDFFRNKVTYVGHVVSADGIEADSTKIEKVRDWPTPTNADELRQFLGFAGYYRKFVQNFSQIARPLNDLLPPTRNKKSSKTPPPSAAQWIWRSEHDGAFQRLKDILCSPVVLGYPDYTLPFELHVDASGSGLGAVLYQQQGHQLRPIHYASRGVSKSERNYPAHKLEFLALKWAITEKFHDYLYGRTFTVYTDNNPLTYILTKAKLDATGHRWLSALSTYNFDIKYRPGKRNADADAMSRLPASIDRDTKEHLPAHSEEISLDSVHAVCRSIGGCDDDSLVESICLSADVVDVLDEDVQGIQAMTPHAWRQLQAQDPCISQWLPFLRRNERPGRKTIQQSPDNAIMTRVWDSLKLKRGVLYRCVQKEGSVVDQLVIPEYMKEKVLTYLHDHVGHPGRDRTLSLLKDRFFWPGMSKDVDSWIKKCPRCVLRKTPTTQRVPLVSIVTTQPMELVCMDYLTLETCKGGYSYVLVVTDHFTRYAQAIPTRNMSAKTTADALCGYIQHYGIPRRFHSDQGANFCGTVIRHLCELLAIEKSRTSPYHPSGNGTCERFNRTLMNMLGTLDSDQKKDWKRFLGPLTYAYNSTRHDTTGYSPFQLLFGRQPRLPVDLVFGIGESEGVPKVPDYVKDLRARMCQSFELASAKAKESQLRQKTTYDLKARHAFLDIGDRVLVKILAFEGRHKLSNRWESEVYVVEGQDNQDIPVYQVRKENGEGRVRTLHRNHLLPVGSLPLVEKPVEVIRPRPVPRTRNSEDQRGRTATTEPVIDRPCSSDSDDSSDDMGEDVATYVPRPPILERGSEPAEGSNSASEDSDESSGDEDEEDSLSEDEPEAVVLPVASPVPAAPPDVPPPLRGVPPAPEPRRSIRERRPPSWKRSGDYVCSQQASLHPLSSEWEKKASFLLDVTSGDAFQNMPETARDALLQILRS